MQYPSCSHPDADDMLVIANENAARDDLDQSEVAVPDPFYLNTFSKCLFPGVQGMKINDGVWWKFMYKMFPLQQIYFWINEETPQGKFT